MQRHRTLMSLVALAVAGLTPRTAAAADGQITSLTSAPSPATTGSPVNIFIGGTPPACGNIDLDFGDGTSHATLSGPFPFNRPHTYNTPGTFTLQATAGQNCTGQVSASLTVKTPSNLAALTAAVANPDLIWRCPPTIDHSSGGAKGFGGEYGPGDLVAVFGCGFGIGEGKWRFVLKLQSANREYDIEIQEWHDDKVLGKIPENITGVMWQPATLQVETSSGQRSNEWRVNFYPNLDLHQIGKPTLTVDCSNAAGGNVCWVNALPAVSAVAIHYVDGVFSHGGKGSDVYAATLKNGCAFGFVNIHPLAQHSGSVAAQSYSIGNQPGEHVDWHVDWDWGNGDVSYYINAYSEGPAGIPCE